MKNILVIITKPPLEDVASVISAHDASEVSVRVLFTQEGVRCSPLVSYPCEALKEDLQTRNLNPSCPVVGYSDMVEAIFKSDLVITF